MKYLAPSEHSSNMLLVNPEDHSILIYGQRTRAFPFYFLKNREMWCLFSMSWKEDSHKVFIRKEGSFSHITGSSASLGLMATCGCVCKPAESLGRVGRQCLGWLPPKLYLAVSAQSRLWVVIGEFRYLFLTSSGRLNKGVNPDPGLFITTLSLLWDPNCGQVVDSRFILLLLSNLQIFFPLKNSTHVFKICPFIWHWNVQQWGSLSWLT